MNKYIEPSKTGRSELLSSLPEQLRSLQAAVEQLSAHFERSQQAVDSPLTAMQHLQQAIDSFLPVVQQLDRRLGAVESSSVSADVIKGLRGEMSRLFSATQQKERLLTLNMTEMQNLRRQVTTLEATLRKWPANSVL